MYCYQIQEEKKEEEAKILREVVENSIDIRLVFCQFVWIQFLLFHFNILLIDSFTPAERDLNLFSFSEVGTVSHK